jgi:hypothetical protein
MNTITDRMHDTPGPTRSNVPPKFNPPAACWNPRVLLALMALAVTALAGPMPMRAALVETSLDSVADPNGPAQTRLARPGAGALDWLAGLGLDGARGPLAGSTQQRQVAAAYGQLPLSFEANVGQSDQRVRFLARGPGYTLFLTASAEAVLVSGKGSPQVARMALADANPQPDVRALEERAAKSYYFIGNDPARWRNKVANYGRVRYQAVYPGIDLVYYGNQRQLEYDLVVAPGADPSRIQLSFPEARQLHLNPESGDVEVTEAGGEVCLHKPVAYQLAEGQQRAAIEAQYALAVGSRVGLALGRYDATQPLIIDPVLAYSTYLGGEPCPNPLLVGLAADRYADQLGIVRGTRNGTMLGPWRLHLTISSMTPFIRERLTNSRVATGCALKDICTTAARGRVCSPDRPVPSCWHFLRPFRGEYYTELACIRCCSKAH